MVLSFESLGAIVGMVLFCYLIYAHVREYMRFSKSVTSGINELRNEPHRWMSVLRVTVLSLVGGVICSLYVIYQISEIPIKTFSDFYRVVTSESGKFVLLCFTGMAVVAGFIFGICGVHFQVEQNEAQDNDRKSSLS